MKDFIKIKEQRIRKNTIKKYQPSGDDKLNVYYNTSRYKIELEVFTFAEKALRDEILDDLDLTFGIN